MEIQQLRCLSAVAEHGSFTKAAAAVHLTQPALSSAIAKLENEFRAKLFNRSARGVTMTAAGELVVTQARQALWALENIESTVASIHGVTAGTLRIVSSRSFTIVIAELAASFTARYPSVKLKIIAPQAEVDVYSLISFGECDIAFAHIDKTPDDLDSHFLKDELLAVLIPSTGDVNTGSTEITWAAVAELPLILPPVGNRARMSIDWIFAERGLSVKAIVENEDYESTLEMVRLGVGACLGTSPTSRIPSGVTMKTITPNHRTRVGVVHRRGGLGPAASAFKALAVEHFS